MMSLIRFGAIRGVAALGATVAVLMGCNDTSDGGATSADDATTATTGDTSGGGGGDTSTIGSDFFRAQIYRAQCAYNLRCHSIADALEADCLENAEQSAQGSLLAYDEVAALAAGRIAVDQSKLDSCLESLRTSGCSSSEVGIAFKDCGLVVVGLVEPGGACFGYQECKGGYCESPNGPSGDLSDGCPGVCRAWVAVGDPCTQFAECPQGTSCRSVCDGECKDVCVALGALGDACSTSLPCGEGLVCRRDPSPEPPGFLQTGSCVAEPLAGEPCPAEEGHACARHLICDRSLEIPTCIERNGDGGPCGSHDFCADGFVCDGGTNDFMNGTIAIAGKCVVPIQVGGACTPPDPETNPTSACVNFTICDPDTKTCVLERALGGETCGTSDTPGACAYGYSCDLSVNKCVHERGLGESCSETGAACVYGTACSESGTCEHVCE